MAIGEDRRQQEAQGVDHDRGRRADRADESASEARSRDLSERLARADLAVRVHELVRFDEHGHVALVGDVEEHGEDTGAQRHDEELRQREDIERVSQGDRAEEHHPPDVAPDQHRSAAPSIDPGAGRKGDDEECGMRARRQGSGLERRRVERDDREERDGQGGDGAADLADGETRPQQDEVAIPKHRLLADGGHRG